MNKKLDRNEFKIVSNSNEFTILRKYHYSTGILWWKKYTFDWRIIDIFGECCIIKRLHGGGLAINTFTIKNKTYDSYNDAEYDIRMFIEKHNR